MKSEMGELEEESQDFVEAVYGDALRKIGRETADRLVDESAGDINVFQQKVIDERVRRQMNDATARAVEQSEERMSDKFEAELASQRLEERSRQVAEEQGNIAAVSGTPGSQVLHEDELEPWEAMVDKYNAGKISYEVFKPYDEAHSRETGGTTLDGRRLQE